MKRAFLSVLLALALCVGLPQTPVRAAQTHNLSDGGDLRALLSRSEVQDGDIIAISGTVSANDTNSDSAPWVIDKNVTIMGVEGSSATIDLRAGGILLGADVTFDGVSLLFTNRVRSAIMANGHTLTLRNVIEPIGADGEGIARTDIHLFCGGLTGHSATATAGAHGTLVLQGSTRLAGNLYAGSISSGYGYENEFSSPASIRIDPAFSGSLGNIYGCGALETPVDDNWFDGEVPAPPTANAQTYKATGGVHIQVNNKIIGAIDGATGGSANASLSFADAGKGYAFTPSLSNISAIALIPSDNGATLNLGTGSSLDNGLDISLPANTNLDLSALGETASFGSLDGGGTLIVGREQTLSFSGEVQGSSDVAVGSFGLSGSNGESLKSDGHVYIYAPLSGPDSFSLVSYQSNLGWKLNWDAAGNWTAVEKEMLLLVRSASAPSQVDLDTENDGADVPLTVEYAQRPDKYYNLGNIPMEVSLNGVAMERSAYSGYYDWYPVEAESTHAGVSYLTVMPDEDEGGGESLALYGTGIENIGGNALPTGSYALTLSIPGDYMADGQPESLSLTITVESSEPPIPGDVNGDGKVTLSDAVHIARHIVEADTLTSERARTAANVNGDDGINVLDVQAVCKYLVNGKW